MTDIDRTDGEISLEDFRDLQPPRPGFHVSDLDSFSWAMERFLDCDSAAAGTEAMAKALMENIDRLRRQHEARRKYLEWRFGPEMIEFARSQLRGKTKTLATPFGAVSFRATQPGVEITDPDAALAYVKALDIPGAIKATEKIMLSAVKSALLDDPPPPGHGISVVGAGETATIKTGIQK